MDRKIRKNKQSYTFYDMYQALPIEVPYSQYRRILDIMCAVILDHILMRSDGFKMPCGLGFIQIGKYLPKNFNSTSLDIDFKSTKEFGKTIYHLDEHSNGYKYRLFWSKIPYTFSDRYKYCLHLVRANKRLLAQLIFNRHDYLNIDDIQLYKM